MTEHVVVLGAGYAGAGAVRRLQSELDGAARLTWISEHEYHLVLHESHRCIRDPAVRSDITIPVREIADPTTEFRQGRVVGLDTDERIVELEDGEVGYDYVLVALGSRTAYYGIPGLEERAMTLKGLEDALAINEAIEEASREASRADPARVVVGGAGLSGIQTAGEVAEFRDDNRAPIDIHIVEALDEIFPGNDPSVQRALRKLLEDAGVTIHTDDPITEADDDRIHFDEGDPLAYDVLVWTGGITGQDALNGADLENQHNRVLADETFQTSDDRVFAIGDSAIVDQEGGPAPPTAQAAWQAAEVAGGNLARAVEGSPLKEWTFDDKGTVVSVGEEAVAHDVKGIPIDTFGGFPARNLKKFIAARWIADLTSWSRARTAWSSL